MKALQLASLYSSFAALSIAANIAGQWLSTKTYAGKHYIVVSMLVGTAIGLVVKYLLDKRWIFRFQPRNRTHELRTFVLYCAMGGATTIVFWATEAVFQFVFQTAPMRYIGALLGLTIGYTAKYALDKRFVFNSPPPIRE